MGLIGAGIKVGAIYAIAQQGMKVHDKHKAKEQQNQQHALHRDASGYTHQAWCNGSCHNQCNGSGYAHQAYCDGRCDGHCNGAAHDSSRNLRPIDSYPQTMNRSYSENEKDLPPKY